MQWIALGCHLNHSVNPFFFFFDLYLLIVADPLPGIKSGLNPFLPMGPRSIKANIMNPLNETLPSLFREFA
jgi:hypothetical protein